MNGQVLFSESDTIRIGEVVISVAKKQEVRPGFKKTTTDTSSLKQYTLGSIADVLSDNPSLSAKTYSPGGSVIASFRGTGASNTRITWNGIPIEHPMLGQSDLSIIPAGMIDNINIYYGGASMALNNGGTGAIISLGSDPGWTDKTNYSLNTGAGSFGKFSTLVKGITGTGNFQSTTRAFFQAAENNFTYINKYTGSEAITETRKNSRFKQSGFIQELFYRTTSKTYSARIWYQSADRSLPSSMIVQQPQGESQYDESLRTLLNFASDNSGLKYSVTGAWVMTRLNYINKTASINSKNLANQVTVKALLQKKVSNIVDLSMSLTNVMNYVNTNNYDGNITRNTSDIMLSADFSNSGKLSANLLLRETLDRKKFLIPDFSTGLQFRILEARKMFLVANISRNSRIPSLNDLYWNPGGNPDLKNEYSYILETGYKMNIDVNPLLRADFDITLFRNSIKDMIQWHPGEFSWWSADNISNATTSGIETNLKINYKSGKTQTTLFTSYSYTRATYGKDQDNSAEQLIYVPMNQGSASLRFSYSKLYTMLQSELTGIRYTTADNSRFLPSYMLHNVACGFFQKIKNFRFDINLEIDNIFSADYQTIAYYPMPGRSYFMKILIESDK